jgi:hypothetical protein
MHMSGGRRRAQLATAVGAAAVVLGVAAGGFQQAPPQAPFIRSSPGGNATPAAPPTHFAGVGRTLLLSTQDRPLTTLGDTLLVHHLRGEVTTLARFGSGIRVHAPGEAG